MYRTRYTNKRDAEGRRITERVPMSQGSKADIARALRMAKENVQGGDYSHALALLDWARAGIVAKMRMG